MNDEVKLLFQATYLPIAHARNRYIGSDFLEVAVKLLDEIRKKTNSSEVIKASARTMVYCFNDLLDPKMPDTDCNGMVNLLVNNSPMLNQFR
jgi:hypothetical protein